MSTVTHQTVKLSRGKHRSPAEGACVMELASMLAGEPFTDHPRSVCPVIGAFLRSYNDAVDDVGRQDLYEYAAKVVGSRSSTHVRREREAHLAEWGSRMRARRTRRPHWLPSLFPKPSGPTDQLGASVVRSIGRHTMQTHGAVLVLVDELLQIGTRERPSGATVDGGCAPSPKMLERTIAGWSTR